MTKLHFQTEFKLGVRGRKNGRGIDQIEDRKGTGIQKGW